MFSGRWAPDSHLWMLIGSLMEIDRRVEELVAPTLAEMGYEIVRVTLGGKQRPMLQILAERKDRMGMTVDDCADISRAVSAILDVEDPIDGTYTLEVSSPGIDRPLTRIEHFERFAGFDAKIETRESVDGRKRFKGRILGTDGDCVLIAAEDVSGLPDGVEVSADAIPIDAIVRAKLLMTDALLAAGQGGRSDGSEAGMPRPPDGQPPA